MSGVARADAPGEMSVAAEDPGGGPLAVGRYHGLDFVRASMMMLGVVLHVALVYQETMGSWVYLDPNGTPLAGLLVVAIHLFRMPVFFVLAGFFGAMLHTRRGVGGFVRNRVVRIAVPMLVGWVVLFPAFMWSIRFAWIHAVLPDRSVIAAVEQARLTGLYEDASMIHLWFLWYLVVLYGVVLAGLHATRLVAAPVAGWCGRAFGAFATGRLRPLRLPVLAIVAFVPMLLMERPGIDTPKSVVPETRILGLYALYFVVGWAAYAHRGVVHELRGWAWGRMGLGLLGLAGSVVLAGVCFRLMRDPEAGTASGAYQTAFVAGQALQALTTWLLVFGLVGVAERVFVRENAVVRYLVDASYWIYLAHLPLAMFIPAAFRDWQAPGALKMVAMMGLVTIPLLVSYHLLVRGTPIGIVLSGRRYPVWPRGHRARAAAA